MKITMPPKLALQILVAGAVLALIPIVMLGLPILLVMSFYEDWNSVITVILTFGVGIELVALYWMLLAMLNAADKEDKHN